MSGDRGDRPGLPHLLARLMPDTALARIQLGWERLVGPEVAAAVKPVAEQDGTLIVACPSAAWATEIAAVGELLVVRVNDELGTPAIRQIRPLGAYRAGQLP